MSRANPATPASATALRSRYMSNTVDAMTPGHMIVALYDRMLLDLERARAAVAVHDAETTHACLLHAQSIVA
jgi:flagellar protein FliS